MGSFPSLFRIIDIIHSLSTWLMPAVYNISIHPIIKITNTCHLLGQIQFKVIANGRNKGLPPL